MHSKQQWKLDKSATVRVTYNNTSSCRSKTINTRKVDQEKAPTNEMSYGQCTKLKAKRATMNNGKVTSQGASWRRRFEPSATERQKQNCNEIANGTKPNNDALRWEKPCVHSSTHDRHVDKTGKQERKNALWACKIQTNSPAKTEQNAQKRTLQS